MVLLEEFKDHKMFLIYDFLQHDVCSNTNLPCIHDTDSTVL